MAMLKPTQISRQAPATALLAGFFLAGTGGVLSTQQGIYGYALPGLRVIEAGGRNSDLGARLLDIIRSLQTTNANIARVMGVSRQTIYNWLRGDTPSQQAQQKLDQLYRVSQRLRTSEIAPKVALSQPAIGGRSFWTLVQEGKDPEQLAEQIISAHGVRSPQRDLIAARMAGKRARGTLRRDAREDLG